MQNSEKKLSGYRTLAEGARSCFLRKALDCFAVYKKTTQAFIRNAYFCLEESWL